MTEARDILQESGKGTIADQSYVTQLSEKYKNYLVGIDDNYTRGATAILMENEMEYLRNLNEDTLSTNVGSFTKYIFPMLRRVFPNLIANQIVSVQPMTAPVGGIFTYEYKYGDRKGVKNPTHGSITNNPYDQNYDGELNSGDEMIKNFGVNYSSEYVDYDVICTDGGGNATVTESTNNGRRPSFLPMRTPGTDAQKTYTVTLYARTAEGGGTDRIISADAAGNLTDQDSNACGTIDFTTGNFTVNAILVAGGASTFLAGTVIYAIYWYNSELVYNTENTQIPSMNLDITLETVKAESRKLKATWSAEAVDDLRALHGLDAEAELVSGISNEIALEIDRQIITELLAGVGHTATYDFQFNGGSAGDHTTEMEAIRGLLTPVEAVSAEIHRTSGRSPANFMVVSPVVNGMLAQLTSHYDYQMNAAVAQKPSYGPLTANFGVTRAGTLFNKYTVYIDPYMPQNDILIGLKGASFLDAGYVFAPYVPLMATPTFQDPDNFMNKKGLRSRYATKMLRPEYYGKITVSNLPTVTTSLP